MGRLFHSVLIDGNPSTGKYAYFYIIYWVFVGNKKHGKGKYIFLIITCIMLHTFEYIKMGSVSEFLQKRRESMFFLLQFLLYFCYI